MQLKTKINGHSFPALSCIEMAANEVVILNRNRSNMLETVLSLHLTFAPERQRETQSSDRPSDPLPDYHVLEKSKETSSLAQVSLKFSK